MFDLFSWSHILVLLVVGLVVVGPKDLPRLMHMGGKWARKARNMASEFRASFDEMARHAELEGLRQEIEALKKSNPVSDVVNSVSAVNDDIARAAGTLPDGPLAALGATPSSLGQPPSVTAQDSREHLAPVESQAPPGSVS